MKTITYESWAIVPIIPAIIVLRLCADHSIITNRNDGIAIYKYSLKLLVILISVHVTFVASLISGILLMRKFYTMKMITFVKNMAIPAPSTPSPILIVNDQPKTRWINGEKI